MGNATFSRSDETKYHFLSACLGWIGLGASNNLSVFYCAPNGREKIFAIDGLADSYSLGTKSLTDDTPQHEEMECTGKISSLGFLWRENYVKFLFLDS